jgi:hypothetical protein
MTATSGKGAVEDAEMDALMLHLSSCSGALPSAEGEGGYFTNAVVAFRGQLDYVLVSKPRGTGSKWVVDSAAPLPKDTWCLGGIGGMPNVLQASDHLPLLVQLAQTE